jgi:hypothetical protein
MCGLSAAGELFPADTGEQVVQSLKGEVSGEGQEMGRLPEDVLQTAILTWNDQRKRKNSQRTRLQLAPLNPKIQPQLDKEGEDYERRNAAPREKENPEKTNEKARGYNRTS